MQELSNDYTIKDRYKIVEKIGNGTLGTAIYLGKDLEKDCSVIIRIIPPSLLGDEEMSTRFIQGIDLAKKLQHPNILRVIDAGKQNDIEYLVTNYEKGFFLNEYLEHRGRLDENESIKLIKSLGEALNYAWNEQQIIHRNVCPDTILVAKGNVPMLTDFDLAKSLVLDNKLTVEGFTIGDPRYMSPEQAMGGDVDFRSDIYCLGLVFYHLLAGNPPFYDKQRMEILRAQISEKHPSVKAKNERITDACETVLDKMLEKDAKKRYQSWKAVIDDLESILNQEPPSTLQKVIAKPRANNYRMQAIQMPAVKAPVESTEKLEETLVSAPKEQPAKPKPSPATVNADTLPAPHATSAPDQAVSAETQKTAPIVQKTAPASNRNLILGVVALIIVVVLIIVLFAIKKDDKAPNITQPSDTQPAPTKKIEPKVEPTPIVQPKVEPKPVVEKTTPETKKPVVSVADQAKEEKHRQACQNNIKQIGVALQMYANVFEGKFPEPSGAKGLELLRSGGFLEMPQVFVCPSSGKFAAAPGQPITEETCDYVYVGGLSEYSDGKAPILWSKPQNHKDFGIILFVNGDVKAVSGSNWLSKTKVKK